jgi:hypothetical protein
MKTFALAVALIAGSVSCAHAQQPPVTAFDGKYLEVSFTAEGGNCKLPFGDKRPLFVQGGVATTVGGLNGDFHFQGTVTADGRAMLRDQNTHIINVKIDPSGKALGIANNGSACTFTRVWQKQG